MKTAIIGGGASGIMAAIFAAENGAEVTLYEKNDKLGKKIFITGKGRCNLTNYSDGQDFLDNVVSNSKFLYSSLKFFDSYSLYSFFEDNGLKLKIERGNRVFPLSDKSSDVIKTLEKLLLEKKVNVNLNTTVTGVVVSDCVVKGVAVKNSFQPFNNVIIATGGISYKTTGSTGDGYNFAKKLGHSITELRGGLTGIDVKENFVTGLAGLTLKNICLNCFYGDKLIVSEFGELLFTHTGISGPVVLTTSSKINKLDCKNILFAIDLKPSLSKEVLDARLLRDFEKNINKQLKNSLFELLPKSLIPIVINLSNCNGDKKINEVTAKERSALVDTIKGLPLKFAAFPDINTAIITSGGVNVNEVNPKTMESRLVKNLYFCGEVLDIDALTGGYNLQIAFSTGAVAGQSSSIKE